MRECWNWQTGTFEGRVLYDVRVQVPSRAPKWNPGIPHRNAGSGFFVFLINFIWSLFGLYFNIHNAKNPPAGDRIGRPLGA